MSFNGVLENEGSLDRYGYNTENNPYYVDEFTYSTPGEIHDPNTLNLPGIMITANSGQSFELEENIKLLITGSEVYPQGDVIHFKTGSNFIKKEGSKLIIQKGGTFICESCDEDWENDTYNIVFQNSKLEYIGNNIIDNGGVINIKSQGNLIISDNTTLTFKGTSTHLKLEQGSNIILGQNSKIVFKNGAYLDADGADFTSSGIC